MAFGRPLLEATCSELPYCEATLKSLLEVILAPEALKQDLPTVSHLLEHPFFESARHAVLAVGSMERPHFKLSSHLKEALQQAVNKAEQRLKDEQKVARHQKRLVKVQEMMSSEEEMKKRKQKLVNILIYLNTTLNCSSKIKKIHVFVFLEERTEIGPRTTFCKSVKCEWDETRKRQEPRALG